MIEIDQENKKLKQRYLTLEQKLRDFPSRYLTDITDIFFFGYHMIITDFYDDPDASFRFSDIHNRAEVIDAYYMQRGLTVEHRQEIKYFESYKKFDVPADYVAVYIPANPGPEAKLVETSVDRRKLRKISNHLKTYKQEYIQLKQQVDQEQAQIKHELDMLKTYAEIAGHE
jgi:hypothetical protein